MVAKSKSLKSYFILVILFSSLIPFLVSVILLSNFISNSNEKIILANSQLKKSYDLEIIDSFHKVQSALNIVAQSEELKAYFNSTIDTEIKNREALYRVIELVKKSIVYEKSRFYVVNTREKVLLSFPMEKESSIKKINLEQEIGVFLSTKNNEIIFSLPISYKLTLDSKNVKKNLGYIVLLLPINEIKNVFPKLMSIQSVSKNLDIKGFTTEVDINYQKVNNISYLYFYIITAFLFICIVIVLGLKIFQSMIIDKILLLRARVRNEMEFIERNELKNELDSLSQTFDLYLRYTRFLQKEIYKSSQLAAAGNIAHVLAHDVKKPFTKLKFFISEIKKLTEIKDIQASINEFEPSFLGSVEYTDLLLNEVMDAGITKLNISEEVKFENILLKSFQNMPIMPENTSVKVEYNLVNNFVLVVDELRV